MKLYRVSRFEADAINSDMCHPDDVNEVSVGQFYPDSIGTQMFTYLVWAESPRDAWFKVIRVYSGEVHGSPWVSQPESVNSLYPSDLPGWVIEDSQEDDEKVFPFPKDS